MAAVARECAVSAKVVEDYFSILEDLLIGVRLPVFTKRTKRRVITRPKFFYFDTGVFQAIHPAAAGCARADSWPGVGDSVFGTGARAQRL